MSELPRRASSWLRWLPYNMTYGWGRILTSELRKVWIRLSHPGAHIELPRTCYLGPGFSLDIPSGGTFIAGEGVEFRRGFRAEIAGEGRIVIGARSVCTYYVLMQCTTAIEIGESCMFGQSTIVVDGQHRFRDLEQPMLAQGYDFTPVHIADHATITTKATIMADVGERALVGANAVVTRPVPPFTVVAGVPARVLDYFGPPGGEPAGFSRPTDANGPAAEDALAADGGAASS
jgi:acetyltransferase-like isoleucine patch superfamily enzyme